MTDVYLTDPQLNAESICAGKSAYGAAISKTWGSCACVIDTPHARHSNVCNSGNPPIFGTERIYPKTAPQLGQHGAGW